MSSSRAHSIFLTPGAVCPSPLVTAMGSQSLFVDLVTWVSEFPLLERVTLENNIDLSIRFADPVGGFKWPSSGCFRSPDDASRYVA